MALSEDTRCVLLSEKLLGRIACAGSQCLVGAHGSHDELNNLSCKICDHPLRILDQHIPPYWNVNHHGEDWKEIIASLAALIETLEFQKSEKPRILITLAIRRIFNHISDAEYLDLAKSSLGQWCLRSLSSSLRELRIAAGWVEAFLPAICTNEHIDGRWQSS